MVLQRYYGLLIDAITEYRQSGKHFIVTHLGYLAGKILGEEAVAVSTVRYWHVEYCDNEGKFRPDERGHYTRELLIVEEDIKRQFVQWSLRKAKRDDLSVEAAREFLNEELLNTLEVSPLAPYCRTHSFDEPFVSLYRQSRLLSTRSNCRSATQQHGVGCKWSTSTGTSTGKATTTTSTRILQSLRIE